MVRSMTLLFRICCSWNSRLCWMALLVVISKSALDFSVAIPFSTPVSAREFDRASGLIHL